MSHDIESDGARQWSDAAEVWVSAGLDPAPRADLSPTVEGRDALTEQGKAQALVSIALSLQDISDKLGALLEAMTPPAEPEADDEDGLYPWGRPSVGDDRWAEGPQS